MEWVSTGSGCPHSGCENILCGLRIVQGPRMLCTRIVCIGYIFSDVIYTYIIFVCYKYYIIYHIQYIIIKCIIYNVLYFFCLRVPSRQKRRVASVDSPRPYIILGVVSAIAVCLPLGVGFWLAARLYNLAQGRRALLEPELVVSTDPFPKQATPWITHSLSRSDFWHAS